MPNEETNIIQQFEQDVFEALIAKGVYLLLFQMTRNGAGFKADTSINLLNGWPVGNFAGSGDTVDSEEFQDQIMGGANKTFISGGVDPGDFTISTYYRSDKGKIGITPIRHSRVLTPQNVLLLATTCDEAEKLEVWWAGGVNYQGGGEIKGDYSKIIGSGLKFKVTGTVLAGTNNCGRIDKTLYGPLPKTSTSEITNPDD